MDTIKTGKQLFEIISLCYHADRPLMLVGGHGIGKSEQAQQAATALGINFHCSDLSLMEPPDLVGLPKLKGQTTIYAPPSSLPTSGSGIWILEELNRCDRHMLAPCLQLLTTRRLNDYELPQGWLPMAAVNPSEDGGYDVNELDPALLSRFVVVSVVPDHDEWLAWAKRHQLHPQVIDYVASDDSIFDHPDSNPRSWKYVSDIVKTHERNGSSEIALRAAVIGAVGIERGCAFLATLKNTTRPLTADEVINDYRKHCKKLRGLVKEGHLDDVDLTLLAVLKRLQPVDEYELVREDPTKWRNLQVFLYDLPGDLLEKARARFKDRDYEFPKQPTKKRKKGVKAA